MFPNGFRAAAGGQEVEELPRRPVGLGRQVKEQRLRQWIAPRHALATRDQWMGAVGRDETDDLDPVFVWADLGHVDEPDADR
ncbi:MAG: hypothetical protein JW809_15040, partial [Pirellulales bacterium]|nr:hypothetical protein [Pirellulales bacterium]